MILRVTLLEGQLEPYQTRPPEDLVEYSKVRGRRAERLHDKDRRYASVKFSQISWHVLVDFHA